MRKPSNPWLLAAAGADFIVAALHVAIALIGPRGYLYFGTTELARLAAQGSPYPAIVTLVLALVFAGFGLYSLSEAGWSRPLPLSAATLLAISALYTLRGLIVILDVVRLTAGAGYPLRQTVFSAGALIIGVLHFVGVSYGRRARARAN